MNNNDDSSGAPSDMERMEWAKQVAKEIYYRAIKRSEFASTEDHARRIEGFSKVIARRSRSYFLIRKL